MIDFATSKQFQATLTFCLLFGQAKSITNIYHHCDSPQAEKQSLSHKEEPLSFNTPLKLYIIPTCFPSTPRGVNADKACFEGLRLRGCVYQTKSIVNTPSPCLSRRISGRGRLGKGVIGSQWSIKQNYKFCWAVVA